MPRNRPEVVSPADLPLTADDSIATWTALLVDPTPELTHTLHQALLRLGAQDVIVSHSAGEVNDIIGHYPAGGELAVVSGRFEADLDAIVRALRKAGWERVLIFNPIGDIMEMSETFDFGVTGVLNRPTIYSPFATPRLTRDLTEKEKEVLSLVAAGLSNPQIGTELGLSTTSIRGHLARISQVMGTGNRSHMVLIALRAGLLPSS